MISMNCTRLPFNWKTKHSEISPSKLQALHSLFKALRLWSSMLRHHIVSQVVEKHTDFIFTVRVSADPSKTPVPMHQTISCQSSYRPKHESSYPQKPQILQYEVMFVSGVKLV